MNDELFPFISLDFLLNNASISSHHLKEAIKYARFLKMGSILHPIRLPSYIAIYEQ